MSRALDDNKEHPPALVRDFDPAMLVTRTPSGETHGRRLSVAVAHAKVSP